MVSNNESKDIDNKIYPCFYFDDRINTMVQSRKKYNNKYAKLINCWNDRFSGWFQRM